MIKSLLTGWHCRRAAWLLQGVAKPGQLLLDAGCGDAPYRQTLRGCHIVGVDLRSAAGTTIIADLGSLPFASQVFDGVLCFQVLYYARYPELWLAELSRVLKPQGWLATSVSRPQAIRREKAAAPSIPLRECQAWRWEEMLTACGFCNITPWWEWLAGRYLGAYIFGLHRKSVSAEEDSQ